MGDIKVISDLITGDLIISADTQFNDVHANTVTILANVNVRIYGTLKNLVLNEGAKLYLHGTIQGEIENRGGDLLVF